MGIADMFIKLGIAYGDADSIDLSYNISKILAQETIKASALLAKEQGMYPGCDIKSIMNTEFYKNIRTPEIDSLVSAYGLRNSQLLTIAPTGLTIGSV